MKEHNLYLHTAEEEIPFSRCTERESMTVLATRVPSVLLSPQGTQDIGQYKTRTTDCVLRTGLGIKRGLTIKCGLTLKIAVLAH